MTEGLVFGETLPEAYHNALKALYTYGDITPCPDYNTEQRECSMTMVVQNPVKEPMISKLFIGGYKELEQYLLEMIDGILDFEIARGNWAYTYHDRMAHYQVGNSRMHIDQIEFVIDELMRNPYSRRAVIMVRHTDDIGSEDPACLQHIQYFIRNGKLDCEVLFRSNDAAKATFMNAFALIFLQKKIADVLGVEVGIYTHRANSFHCYARDYEMLEGYVRRIIGAQDNLEKISYSYEDEWKEFMDDSIQEILENVKKLKGV